LSVDRDRGAIHGEEALAGDMLTMKTLVDEGRLRTTPGATPDVALRIQAAHSETRAIVGYLTTNCGVCYQTGSVAPSLGASLKHRDVLDADAVTAALANQPTSWQLPGTPDGTTRVIDRAHPEQSALYRMRTRRPSSQMAAAWHGGRGRRRRQAGVEVASDRSDRPLARRPIRRQERFVTSEIHTDDGSPAGRRQEWAAGNQREPIVVRRQTGIGDLVLTAAQRLDVPLGQLTVEVPDPPVTG